jgi:hypothetical protein
VYLYNDIFAVLSIQTQTIHLFQIQVSLHLFTFSPLPPPVVICSFCYVFNVDYIYIVFHILTREQGSRFLDVRTIGTQCYEDDDLAFAQQQELERQYEQQQQQQLNQAKASTTASTHPDPMQTDSGHLPQQPTSSSCDKEMNCSTYLDYTHEVSAPLFVYFLKKFLGVCCLGTHN